MRFIFFCRRKSQQAEREYEKVKHQLESLEESVRDRCKKEFTGGQNFGSCSQACTWNQEAMDLETDVALNSFTPSLEN